MVKEEKPKIIFVMGLAFTGSTLFSLYLGKHKGIINLGEVDNLENDFNEKVRCTCGNILRTCQFWNNIKVKLDGSIDTPNFELSNESERSAFDKKGLSIKKLLVAIGVDPVWVYGKKFMESYIQKNVAFFSLLSANFKSTDYFVDCSKNYSRIELLLKHKEIDGYVIKLTRDPLRLFHSNLKRKKKTRNMIPFKVLREAFFLCLRDRQSQNLFEQIPNEKKIIVDFDKFRYNPIKEYNKVLKLIYPNDDLPIEFDRKLYLRNQHVYVGNRWLFREDLDKIFLKRDKTEDYSLSQIAIFTYKTMRRFFNIKS